MVIGQIGLLRHIQHNPTPIRFEADAGTPLYLTDYFSDSGGIDAPFAGSISSTGFASMAKRE